MKQLQEKLQLVDISKLKELVYNKIKKGEVKHPL